MNQAKTAIIMLLACFITGNVFAQDRIFKKNGEVLEVKVKEVGPKTITYSRFDMPDGPSYTINKNEVMRIEYKNGVEDTFDRHGDVRSEKPEVHTSKRPKLNYGKNILSVSPFGLTENGPSLMLAYERSLDANGIFSFYLPVIYSFQSFDQGNFYNYNTGTYETPSDEYMLYFNPGFKVYPGGAFGKVRYAVGPQLCIATGREYDYFDVYDNNGVYIGTQSGYQDRFTFGVMVNNSLNISPTEHLYLGLDFSVGLSYINRINDRNTNTRGLVNMGFKVGYRF